MKELTNNTEGLYQFYSQKLTEKVTYFHSVSESTWNHSMFHDQDAEGNLLFQELITLVYKKQNEIKGFIQFGKPTYIYQEDGSKDFSAIVGVIRQCYFEQEEPIVGQLLIEQATQYFNQEKISRRFAFYHAFGLTHTASHGKLPITFAQTEQLLLAQGYQKEHENFYFAKVLDKALKYEGSVQLIAEKKQANQQNFSFMLDGNKIGTAILTYLHESRIAYLRWIGLAQMHQNQGYGSEALQLISNLLIKKEIKELHLDTADTNKRAQHFYLKNGFQQVETTRSYLIP